MPANLVFNSKHTRHIDAAVRTITVNVGSIILTDPDGSSGSIDAGQDHTFDPPLAGLVIYAPTGARVNLIYGDDPVVAESAPEPAKKVRRRTPRSSTATKRAAKRTSAKSSKSKKKG